MHWAYLKHHTDMCPIYTADLEIIEQLDRAMAEGVALLSLPDTFEQLDFVQGSFGVMCCALDNFEGNKRLFPVSLCILTPSCLLVAVG